LTRLVAAIASMTMSLKKITMTIFRIGQKTCEEH